VKGREKETGDLSGRIFEDFDKEILSYVLGESTGGFHETEGEPSLTEKALVDDKRKLPTIEEPGKINNSAVREKIVKKGTTFAVVRDADGRSKAPEAMMSQTHIPAPPTAKHRGKES